MMWLQLTLEDDAPTWVNIDAFVEMNRMGSVTTLYTGHFSMSDDSPEYFHTRVKETPEEILDLIRNYEDLR